MFTIKNVERNPLDDPSAKDGERVFWAHNILRDEYFVVAHSHDWDAVDMDELQFELDSSVRRKFGRWHQPRKWYDMTEMCRHEVKTSR